MSEITICNYDSFEAHNGDSFEAPMLIVALTTFLYGTDTSMVGWKPPTSSTEVSALDLFEE